MHTHLRWSLLLLSAAVLAAALNAGRADDEKKTSAAVERKEIDGLAYQALRDVINRGAEMYNTGDVAGCWRLYEGALMMLRPMLEHRPELQKAISDGIAAAGQNPFMDRRAWVLRDVIDKVRLETNPKPKPAPIAAPKTKKDDEKKNDTPPVPKEGDKKEPPPAKSSEKPLGKLWERLGGEDKVSKAMDEFWDAVKDDQDHKFFRKLGESPTPDQIKDLKDKLKAFINAVSGGPLADQGKTTKEALRGMGIPDKELDALAKRLAEALKKAGATDDDAKELLKKLEESRKDIVE
jgi:truncated hemoglobin YjbI